MIMQLTEAQCLVLEPACGREDLCIFPTVATLKGGAVGNICKSLLTRGLIREVPATQAMTVWRHDEERGALTLQATEAGKLALEGDSITTPKPELVPARPNASAACAASIKESRQDVLLRLLGRPDGATIADMAEATGWQSHSVRGALSGVIGKRLGLKVTSDKLPDRSRVYRVG